MKKNILYLMEMGMNDNNITTDIKNHRVRVLENIDIFYNGKAYNMFFEFTQCNHFQYRTTNKRTGATLKNPIRELVIKDGLGIDTEFEQCAGTWADGTPYFSSFRNGNLEKEIWNEHHAYTKKDILEIVNRYKIGEKFTDVILVEEETARIINKIGGYREKEILAENSNFRVDGDSYMKKGDTWNNEHKIVQVCRQKWIEEKNGRRLDVVGTCEVDLVTGKITG